MTQASLKVDGMTCNHCVETITSSLEKFSGVLEVIINLEEKEVTLNYDEARIGLKEICSEISTLGFEIIHK